MQKAEFHLISWLHLLAAAAILQGKTLEKTNIKKPLTNNKPQRNKQTTLLKYTELIKALDIPLKS